MVKVEIDLPKEQYDFLCEGIEASGMWGSLEEFVEEAVREHQLSYAHMLKTKKVRVEPDLADLLKSMAEEKGVSITRLVNDLCKGLIKHLEEKPGADL